METILLTFLQMLIKKNLKKIKCCDVFYLICLRMKKIEQTLRDGSTEYNRHFFYKKPEPQSICSVINTKCLTPSWTHIFVHTLTEVTILKNIFNRFTLLFIKWADITKKCWKWLSFTSQQHWTWHSIILNVADCTYTIIY